MYKTPGVSKTNLRFKSLIYNHVRRLRLEKLLYLPAELSRLPNGHFKPLLDLGSGCGFKSETAVFK
jgi:hypothetical protein